MTRLAAGSATLVAGFLVYMYVESRATPEARLALRSDGTVRVTVRSDDVLFELMINGAVGWFAGYPNAFPKEAVELYNLCADGQWHEAKALYEQLVAVFRWDSRTEFVQAIKLSMDICGNSYGGPTRPPRGPLSAEQRAQVTADTERALAALAARTAAVA